MNEPAGEVVDVTGGCVELGTRPVLRGIDLGVGRGEVVAVLGANGSGKSTLVRSLLGLVPLTRGDVRLFGIPLDRFDEWRRIGYVPQRATAGAGVPASVGEVVAAGRLAHRRPFRPATREDRRAVRAAIDAVGLGNRVHDGVATLSGGQQQRVLIARALAGRPDLLVMDEPTAGIDLESQEHLAAVMTRLVDAGTTVLLVAHEIGPLGALIGRSVVMRDGRVVYDGAPLPSFQQADGPAHHHPDDPRLQRQHPFGVPAGHEVGIAVPFDRAADEGRP